MKKIFKYFIWFIGVVILVILLSILGFWAKVEFGVKISEHQSFENTELYAWNKVRMNDNCKCSDQSDFWIYSKKGNSDNLIVHFSGGGACWDDKSCTNPIGYTSINGFYFPNIFEWTFKGFVKGAMENQDDRNPFKDWNIVFIPYCSGDLHIGNQSNEYIDPEGNTLEVVHNGKTNVLSAINWIKENFHQPQKVLISGESAGGFGSIFWTPEIVEMYPASKFYQLSDCSFIDSEVLLDAVELWNAETEKTFGYKIDTDILNSALYNSRQQLIETEITFLQSFTLYDEVLLRFEAAINNKNTENNSYIFDWSNQMLKAVHENADSLNNYYFFITDWKINKEGKTPHTLIANDGFFECSEEGIKFKDWLADVVIKEQPFSVGIK